MSTTRNRIAVLALTALVAAGASGCGETEATETPVPQADGRAASPRPVQVVRRQPDTAAERPADLPEPPAAGSVELTPSAFTDRVRATDLRLEAGARPRVTGRLTSVTDVSEVLLLVVEATFYDRDGKVAGTDTVTFTEAEAFHDEPLRFAIRAPRAAAGAIAARVTVPELVNE